MNLNSDSLKINTIASKQMFELKVTELVDCLQCKSPSQYLEKIFPLPSAKIEGGGIICTTTERKKELKFNLTGTAPWTLKYSDGNQVWTETNILVSPHSVWQEASGVFHLTYVEDAYCHFPQ